MTPAEVRDEITRSGLRGRGGAGYPTGLKWNTVAKAAGRRQVRHLQRRRGGPRRVHGPERPRERPVPGPRGDGDRGVRGRRQARATCTAVPSTRSRSRRLRKAIRDAGRSRLPGRVRPGHRVRIRGRRPARAPARSCVARRRRSSRRSRAAGHAESATAVSRRGRAVGSPDAHQQRRDVRQRRAHHPQRRRLVRGHRDRRRARAPRCSPSPVGS